MSPCGPFQRVLDNRICEERSAVANPWLAQPAIEAAIRVHGKNNEQERIWEITRTRLRLLQSYTQWGRDMNTAGVHRVTEPRTRQYRLQFDAEHTPELRTSRRDFDKEVGATVRGDATDDHVGVPR